MGELYKCLHILTHYPLFYLYFIIQLPRLYISKKYSYLHKTDISILGDHMIIYYFTWVFIFLFIHFNVILALVRLRSVIYERMAHRTERKPAGCF